MRPLPVSCFVVSFSYWTCDMSALWFQVFLFETDVWATQTLWECDARVVMNPTHVGRIMYVARSTSMIIWCDHCLLAALWFRFHIELATCLLFGFRSSYLRPMCERHRPSENATREYWWTPRMSSISFRSYLGSLEQPLFSRMALRHRCYV